MQKWGLSRVAAFSRTARCSLLAQPLVFGVQLRHLVSAQRGWQLTCTCARTLLSWGRLANALRPLQGQLGQQSPHLDPGYKLHA